MNRLRKRSLASVWVTFLFFGALNNAYRMWVVQQPVGYWVTNPTSWLQIIPQAVILNVPDMVSAGIYVVILCHSNKIWSKDEPLQNVNVNGGDDGDHARQEYLHGIYAGPAVAPPLSGGICPSVSSILATLPGQASGDKKKNLLLVFVNFFFTHVSSAGSEENLAEILKHPSSQDQQHTPSGQSTRQCPPAPPPTPLQQEPVAPPPPAAAPSPQHQHPAAADATACAVRGIGTHVTLFNLDLVILPVLNVTLPAGSMREAILFAVGTLGGFWVPLLFILYNVTKLRLLAAFVFEEIKSPFCP